MTSTNYNIGVGDLKRPTSKVLAPPGGQTSISLGNRTSMGNDSSSLKSALIDDIPAKPVQPAAAANGNSTNGNECSNAPASGPTRTRVPPGGFSSGLW